MTSLQPKSAAGGTAATTIDADNYRFLQDYIHRESGIVIELDKHYLLEARLLPVARQRQLNTVNDLCALLRATKGADGVRRQVVEAMTTHETLFFRDLPQYEALRDHILPKLVEERGSLRKLSVWSAAASSGQESYSLAMMLLEMGLRDWRIRILGTDLSEQVLERARKAKYMQIEVNRGLPASYLVKYFTRQGLEWQLKDVARNMVEFQQLDLRNSLRTMGPFDVVFCRNVLIYFDVPTKKKLLEEIRSTIHNGGYLLLGGAESTFGLSDRFERITIGQASLYRAV